MAIKKVTLLSLDDANEAQLDNLYSLGSEVIGGKKKSVKVAMSLLRGNTAFREWQNKNPGKTYADWIALLQAPAQEAADGIDKLKDDLTKFGNAAIASENARVEAEAQRVIVEGVRVEAEKARASAEQLREDAEELRDETETERINAEAVRKETESGRVLVEGLRVDEEAKRAAAELIRLQSEQGRVTEEAKRVEEEQKRATAEALRDKSETNRDEAEELRDRAETLRASEEVDRDTAEQDRLQEEQERDDAEKLRLLAEITRSETEDTRIVDEQLRKISEQERKEAETGRETAEEAREVNTTQAILDTEEATKNAKAATAITLDLNAHPMKIMGGIWFEWNVKDQEYKNTGIQAKGNVGSSFKIIGRYDTLDELKAAVPDGTNVDGVYAVGAVEPFSYYAWLVVDGVWQWDDQGKLRGAEGKSSFEVWTEKPENAGKTEEQYFDWLSPVIDSETGRWKIQGEDQGVQALGIDAEVTEKENEEDRYILHVKSAKGEFDTPNLRGFDVKVEENASNTPDDYKLKITTVTGEFLTPNLRGQSSSRVLDIDHEPTEADTHYTYNGVVYAYSIGDERRYYDPDLEEFVFYKCYDLNTTGAVWDELGGGGGRLPTDVILCSPLDFDDMEDKIMLNNGILE